MTYYTGINENILDMVDGENLSICEFGCAAGLLAKAIREKTKSVDYYVGADFCLDPLLHASNYINAALHIDLDVIGIWDSEEFSQKVPDGKFDYIIFGDVLEHLKNPEVALKNARKKLRENGRLLICIPNAQHWSVLLNIVKGRWPREASGIFDKTHLRWFTLKEMVLILQENGFEVAEMVPRIFNHEMGFHIADALTEFCNKIGINHDEATAGMIPFQYVFNVKKSK